MKTLSPGPVNLPKGSLEAWSVATDLCRAVDALPEAERLDFACKAIGVAIVRLMRAVDEHDLDAAAALMIRAVQHGVAGRLKPSAPSPEGQAG